MSRDKEKKDRIIGMLISVGIHAAIILLFFFILAWKQPYPPKPEYGIELNIGMEEEGSGEEQLTDVSNAPQENAEEEQAEETTPEEQPEEQVSEEVPATPPEIPEQQPREVEEQPVEDIPDSRQEESPVEATPEVKEEIQEPVKEIVPEPEPQQPEEQPKETEQPAEPVKEQAVEEPVKEPTINKQAMYPVKRGGNQGDTKDEVGDAGKPEGTIEAQAIYGKQGGGGGGPKLDLPGWKWDFTPNPEDTTSEEGKIVFEIKVDEQGYVTGVKTLEYSVNPDILQIYRKEVYRLTFSPTNANTAPPPVSEGKITFIIRAK